MCTLHYMKYSSRCATRAGQRQGRAGKGREGRGRVGRGGDGKGGGRRDRGGAEKGRTAWRREALVLFTFNAMAGNVG